MWRGFGQIARSQAAAVNMVVKNSCVGRCLVVEVAKADLLYAKQFERKF
jgi:hypothetical protein